MKILPIVIALSVLGAGSVLITQRDNKYDARNDVETWYYSLPKVVPNTNGKAPWVGYEGPVVNWDGTKEIWPDTLRDEYVKRAPSGAKVTDLETQGLDRL